MDPVLAMKVAEATEAAFRRDYLVASVVVLLVVNGAWAYAVRGLVRKLSEVQDARVQDHKEGAARYEGVSNRMAVHMDKSTEATVAFLTKAQAARGARAAKEPVP